MTRHIAFLIFPGFQILDAAGPICAFETATRIRPGAYALHIMAARPGAIGSSSGAALMAGGLARPPAVDTLVVAGGDGIREALQCPRTRRFIQACATRARRVTSVCSGSFLLAAAGLLDGKRAATHWKWAAELVRPAGVRCTPRR